MKKLTRIAIAAMLMVMSALNVNAIETQIYHIDFTDAAQNATLTQTKGAVGTSLPSWASGVSAYYLTSGSAGAITIPGVEFNAGGRIVIKWGSASSRPLTIKTASETLVNREKLESSERSTVLTESYTIESTVDGSQDLTFMSSGGGSVYFFDITIYTNAKGPVVTNFTLDGYVADEINANAGTIHVTVPYSYDLDKTQLPVWELQSGTTFKTASDETTGRNFSTAQSYVFTDGSEDKTYTVTVEHAPASTVNTLDGLKFDIDGETRTATISGTTVTLKLPFSYSDGKPNAAKRKSIASTFTYSDELATAALSSGAAVTSGTSQTVDYTTVTDITVTAESGAKNAYSFAIEYDEASHACDLTKLVLPLKTGGTLEATIDQTAKTATATMTTANFNKSMTPTVTTSPLSEYAVSTTDYSKPVTYTVTAEDGTTSKQYVLTINLDDKKPTVTVDYPADKAEGISLAGNIKLTFTETDNKGNAGAIKTGTTKVHIKGGSIDKDLDATITGDLTASVNFSGLESLTEYTLTIPVTAFTDSVGNQLSKSVTTTFKTADGTLHTADLPYTSKMDGDDFAQPAFITGTYDATVSTMGATTDMFGAYKIEAGESLQLNAESAGVFDAVFYSKGTGSFSITDGTSTTAGSFTEYDNDGQEVTLAVNKSAATTITITNTGTTPIYVPYISVSADANPISERQANCKN